MSSVCQFHDVVCEMQILSCFIFRLNLDLFIFPANFQHTSIIGVLTCGPRTPARGSASRPRRTEKRPITNTQGYLSRSRFVVYYSEEAISKLILSG